LEKGYQYKSQPSSPLTPKSQATGNGMMSFQIPSHDFPSKITIQILSGTNKNKGEVKKQKRIHV